MTKRNTLFTLLLLLLLPLLAHSQDLLVTGGWVFTATGDTVMQNPGIVIRNGMIDTIGTGDLNNRDRYRVLELGDNDYLLPGLIDMHAHYRVEAGGKVFDDTVATPKIFLANGVTTTYPAGEIEPHKMRELRIKIDRGERTGPRIYNSGPYFGTAAPDWHDSMTVRDIYDRVDYWAERGVKGFKAKGITKQHLDALIQRAHWHGLPVTAHLNSGVGGSVNPEWAIRRGIDRIEHFLGGELLADSAHAYASLRNMNPYSPKLTTIINLYLGYRTWFDPTLSTYGIVGENNSSAFDRWTDETRYLTPQLRKQLVTAQSSPYKDLFGEIYETKKITVMRYYDRGGKLTMGTDRPLMRSLGVYLGGFSAHRELQALNEAGIPNAAVLKIATINGARALKAEEKLGSIEAGKQADMFVVTGNPLEDITRTRSVHTVIKGGHVYRSEELLKSVEGKLGIE